MSFYSPLRYPGGKRKLAPFIQSVIERNGLTESYVEPYAGGASIALHLLFNEVIDNVHINDLSYPIYCFWHSVLHENSLLVEEIDKIDITIEEWKIQKAILENPNDKTMFQIGFAAFFLNRTNFSGILNGGVIGGLQQAGNYTLDARFPKKTLTKRIQSIGRLSRKINLTNLDAANFLQNNLPSISQNSLVYLDPPYFVKGQGLYENHYTPEDHRKIGELITSQSTHPWIVSYDDVPEIRSIYSQWSIEDYQLYYNANERKLGSEIMFFSENLKLPELEKTGPVH